MIVDQRGDEMQLQIGSLQTRLRADEGAALSARRGDEACTVAPPAQDLAHQVHNTGGVQAEHVPVMRAIAKDEIDMILKVLADTRQIEADIDACLLEFGAGPDAGQEQQLWRVERTAAEDHLAAGTKFEFLPSPPNHKSGSAVALEQNARRQRPRHHGQVRPGHDGMEIGGGG